DGYEQSPAIMEHRSRRGCFGFVAPCPTDEIFFDRQPESAELAEQPAWAGDRGPGCGNAPPQFPVRGDHDPLPRHTTRQVADPAVALTPGGHRLAPGRRAPQAEPLPGPAFHYQDDLRVPAAVRIVRASLRRPGRARPGRSIRVPGSRRIAGHRAAN